MSVKILEIKNESCPSARFIGKRYLGNINWGEWWEKDWFSVLERTPGLPINDNGYIGAMHYADGVFEYWIGMFFPENTAVPDGFEYADIAPVEYAVFYLYGNPSNRELFSADTYSMCLKKMKEKGIVYKEGAWRFERYNCPRYTAPDEHGNVILDYAFSVEK